MSNFQKATDCTGPVSPLNCSAFGNLLYDPCYAAPGFWTGCSSTDATECVPGETPTSWRGVALTLDGSLYPANITTQAEFQCPDGFYCPGFQDTTICPGLCPPGYFCNDTASIEICPQDHYCPAGTVSPLACPLFSVGCNEGSSSFNGVPAVILGLAIFVVMSVCLMIASYCFKKSLRKDTAMRNSLQSSTNGKQEKALLQAKPSMANRLQLKENQNISFAFQDMSLKLPNGGPTILKGVTGTIPSGQLTAIMGPSGAGKTTFLSVLSGKADRTGGNLQINGQKDEIYNYKRVVGFVPQEDVMHRDLTVFENIMHSAETRLPVEWTKEQRLQFVNYVIEVLGLERVRNSIIGDANVRGISGGQRKRVNIALELVSNPAVLFLDEPTSGLDSTSSSVVLNALKEFASRGVNVVTVLHQPKYEIYSLFDQILILGVGGKTVFMGSPQEADAYFKGLGFICPESVNPADFYMDVVAGIIPKENDPDFTKSDLFHLWDQHKQQQHQQKTGQQQQQDDDSRLDMNFEPVNLETDKKRSIDNNYVNMDKNTDNETQTCCTGLMGSLAVPFVETKNAFVHAFQSDPSASQRQTVGFFTQFWLFYKRSWCHRLHNPVPTVVFSCVAVIASIILAFSFKNNTLFAGIPVGLTDPDASEGFMLAAETYTIINGYSFLTLFYWTLVMLVATTHGVTLIGFTRIEFFREMSTGVYATAYYVAAVLEVLPWIILNALLYASIFYGILDLRAGFGNIFVITLPTYMGFFFIGVLASFTKRENMNVVAIIVGLLLTILFTGLTPKAGSLAIGIKWIWYCTFTYWTAQGFNSISLQQYEDVYDVEMVNNDSNYGAGFTLDTYSLDIALSYVTMFALVVLAGYLLKMVDYKKQR